MSPIDPRAVLGGLRGGRVLDVATGGGDFVGFLLDGLDDVSEVVGVDTNGDLAARFAEALADRPGVRFEVMDAHALAFADASFDTVAVSNSLHHVVDPVPVLVEMLRVVRPGGLVIVNEMYRDGQTETQLTHVLLHHWWAAVARATGQVHRETYERAQILAILDGLGLADLRVHDLLDPDEDPHDPATIADLEGAIDRFQERTGDLPELRARGEDLRARLRAIGATSATQLVAVGRALGA